MSIPGSYGIPSGGGIPPLPGSAPPSAPPAPLDREKIERAAYQALGLPYYKEAQRTDHEVGTLQISSAIPAISASVAASGLPLLTYRQFEQDHKRIRTPQWVDILTPDIRGYLSYIEFTSKELYTIISKDLPFFIPEEPRFHAYCLGASGSGKTEFVKARIRSTVEKDLASVVVIEPAGEFVDEVAHWPVCKEKLVLFQLGLKPGFRPIINPFQIYDVAPEDTSDSAIAIKVVMAQQIAKAMEEVLGKGAEFSTNMDVILTPCILTLLDRPGATLLDLQRFMVDGENEDLIEFGMTRHKYESVVSFFPNFKKADYKRTKVAIYNRIQALIAKGPFAQMTCGDTTVWLEDLLDRKHVVLFNLSKEIVGDDESPAFGRLLIALLQGIAIRRNRKRPEDRTPTWVFIDEFTNYVSPSVETILMEARKYKMFLWMLQQDAGTGMSPEMRRVVFANTQVTLTGTTAPIHRERAARLFPVTQDRFEKLEKGRFLGRFGMNAPVIEFQTRSDLVGSKGAMSRQEWDQVVEDQIARYYRPMGRKEAAFGGPSPLDYR